jgi:hypothetical protein
MIEPHASWVRGRPRPHDEIFLCERCAPYLRASAPPREPV